MRILQKYMSYVLIFLLLTSGLLGYLYFSSAHNYKMLKGTYSQNILALNDSLKKVQYKNEEMYHKYIEFQDLSKEQTALLKNKDEKIKTLTTQVIQLNNVISDGTGVVYVHDTIKTIDSACIGLKLNFKKATEFYTYNLDVVINNPSYHRLDLQFSPISLTTYLTRNKQGVFSSYFKVEPATLNKYIQITSARVQMEQDDYIPANKPEYGFLPMINLSTHHVVSIGGGVQLDKHIVGYLKGINSTAHSVFYAYRIIF
jgi:hypothetical protein